MNDAARHAESPGKLSLCSAFHGRRIAIHTTNQTHSAGIKFPITGSPIWNMAQPHSVGMDRVLSMRHYFEIPNRVVSLVAVNVIDRHAARARSGECSHHNRMNGDGSHIFRRLAGIQANAEISAGSHSGAQHSSGDQGSNIPGGTDLVSSFVPRHWQPSFHEHWHPRSTDRNKLAVNTMSDIMGRPW